MNSARYFAGCGGWSAVADITRRFRSATSIPYVQAVCVMLEYARDHLDEDFACGPLNIGALMHNGLVLTGPPPVVERIVGLLEHEVPGLYPAES